MRLNTPSGLPLLHVHGKRTAKYRECKTVPLTCARQPTKRNSESAWRDRTTSSPSKASLRMSPCSEKQTKIAVFLDFVDERTGPLYAQTVVKRIFDEGHHVAIFAYTSRRKVLPVFEVPSNPDFINQEPQEAMERNVREADGILLLTDQPVYGVPQYLDSVRKYLINGHLFSWNLYGVRCVLLGGSVHKRKVAMQLRHLLEDSSNLLVGRVLPQPCFLKKLYAVDPQVETEGPCVL